MVRQGVGLIPCVSETDGEPLLAMWLMAGTRSAGFNRYRRAYGGAGDDGDLTHPGADLMPAVGAETRGRARRYQPLRSQKPMPYALFYNDARLSFTMTPG